MWTVVIRENGAETMTKPKQWGEAFRDYERKAKKINALTPTGEYKYPHIRLSLRKA